MKRSALPATKHPVATNGKEAIDFGSLADSVGYALRRAQLASFKTFKRVCGETGLTPAQYSALVVIDRNPGLRQTQVSAALGIKRANFVALIDALEQRGLAARTAASDRRSHALHLTAAGKALLANERKYSRVLNEKYRILLGGEKQRQALLTFLDAVAQSEDDGADE